MKVLARIPLLLTLTGCPVHEVTTAEEWCKQLAGVDLYEETAPFWALMPGIEFNGDAIRDDFAGMLNKMLLEKVENRADRMAWREGNDLHLMNISTFFVIEPSEIINEWRTNIEMSKKFEHPDDVHRCLYGSITSLFDSMTIHTVVMDDAGLKVEREDLTRIETDRKAILKDPI